MIPMMVRRWELLAMLAFVYKTFFFMATPATVQCLLLLLLGVAASWQRTIPWACTPPPVENTTRAAESAVRGSD